MPEWLRRLIMWLIQTMGIWVDSRAFPNLVAAVAAIGDEACTLYVGRSETINRDLTIPANITLKFKCNAILTIAPGATLTVTGVIDAELRQIFAGEGTITGRPQVSYIHPEWFGAQKDGAAVDGVPILERKAISDRVPIQKAIDLAEASGVSVFISNGDYYLDFDDSVKDAYVLYKGEQLPAYRCLKIDDDSVHIKFDQNAWFVVKADAASHYDPDEEDGDDGDVKASEEVPAVGEADKEIEKGIVVIYLSGVSNCVLDGLKIRSRYHRKSDMADDEPHDEIPNSEYCEKKPAGDYFKGVVVGAFEQDVFDESCDHVIIKNAHLKYLGSGIKFVHADHCHVYDSHLHHCYDTAFNGSRGSTMCTIERCTVTHSGDGTCTFYNTERCGIRGCYLTGSGQVAAIELSHYTSIEDCFFDGADGSVHCGPIVNRCRHATVRGNKIVGVHYGIILRNTDDRKRRTGIPVWGALVEGNQIIETQERIVGQHPTGLWIEYSSNVLVVGNTFMRTQMTGTKRPREIRILDRGARHCSPDPPGRRNENIRVIGNQFILKHPEVTEREFEAYCDTHYVLEYTPVAHFTVEQYAEFLAEHPGAEETLADIIKPRKDKDGIVYGIALFINRTFIDEQRPILRQTAFDAILERAYPLSNLSFNHNTIIGDSASSWPNYLVEVGYVKQFQFIGNSSRDVGEEDTGPAHLLSGYIRQGVISNNNLAFSIGDLINIRAESVVISNNTAGSTYPGSETGDFLQLQDRSAKTAVTGNVITGCSHFVTGGNDTHPVDCIIKNNIVVHTAMDPILNMDDRSNISHDNILTNY